MASEFFEYVAQTCGHLDNIIFEVYNEPKGSWGINAANKEGKNVDEAIKAGYSVFITEWGTGNADSKGTPGVAANDKWQTWVDEVRNQVK